MVRIPAANAAPAPGSGNDLVNPYGKGHLGACALYIDRTAQGMPLVGRKGTLHENAAGGRGGVGPYNPPVCLQCSKIHGVPRRNGQDWRDGSGQASMEIPAGRIKGVVCHAYTSCHSSMTAKALTGEPLPFFNRSGIP